MPAPPPENTSPPASGENTQISRSTAGKGTERIRRTEEVRKAPGSGGKPGSSADESTPGRQGWQNCPYGQSASHRSRCGGRRPDPRFDDSPHSARHVASPFGRSQSGHSAQTRGHPGGPLLQGPRRVQLHLKPERGRARSGRCVRIGRKPRPGRGLRVQAVENPCQGLPAVHDPAAETGSHRGHRGALDRTGHRGRHLRRSIRGGARVCARAWRDLRSPL